MSFPSVPDRELTAFDPRLGAKRQAPFANFALERVPGPPTVHGRMLYPSSETGAPSGSSLSATFFLLPASVT